MAEIQIADFDKVELSPPRLDVGSGYVFGVENVQILENEKNNNKYLEVTLRCVEGPDQTEADPITGLASPKGRVIKDRVYLTEGAKWRVKALLIASGLLARDDKTSEIARGHFDSDILLGSTVQCSIESQMNEGKEYRNVVYSV